MFQNVDWTRTRAYGLGLNGLYINVRGRERNGIVAPEERERLVNDIRRKLLDTVDPQTGRAVVAKAMTREQAYRDSAHFNLAPDIIVLYTEGTRGSNESALGGVPREILVDNTGEWSGDHCMDPDAVPGVLLVSRPLQQTPATLIEIGRAIQAEVLGGRR
jgi:predicted AlkP superfamily phosphohydrolase/phosphomutase